MSEFWKPIDNVLDDSLSLDTKCTSSRPASVQSVQEPLTVPIYHSSTYKVKNVEEYLHVLKEEGNIYSRLGNPTVKAAETTLNAIEGGAGSLLFSSGMAAIQTALLGCLSSGDHVVMCNPVYSATLHIAQTHLTRFGIETTFVDGNSAECYEKAIKSNTKLLYAETPRNPTIDILDLKALAAVGQKHNILTFNDGTFASPYLQHAIKLGIDISMHSCTKYLGGHSDLLGGVLTFKDLEKWKYFQRFSKDLGNTMNPWEASLLIRGVKTLHLRMSRISDNAERLAAVLEKNDAVSKVHYPGLPSHPGHETAKTQMSKFGGMIAFELKGGLESGKKFVTNVELINFAVSLGGVETLVEHPASMTHGPMLMSDEDRETSKISEGLIRMSVGIEDPDDLEKDLIQALEKL